MFPTKTNPLNNRHHKKLSLAGVLAFSLLAASMTSPLASAAEMVFTEGVRVSISEYGTMNMALVSGAAPATSRLNGTMEAGGKKSIVNQAWGGIEDNKAKVAATENEVQASGVLITSKDDPSPGAKVADFHITYKKVSPGELSVNIELTYSAASQWKFPFGCNFSFPIAALQGGSCELEAASGSPEKFAIDAKEIEIPPQPHKSVKISQGKQSVTIRPSDDKSKLVLQDTRSYKSDALIIALFPKRAAFTTPLFTTSAGQKESFGATIRFDATK